MNKKDKKNIAFFIAGFLVLIFVFNQNIIKKFYNILKLDYESRLSKSSGFCGGDSAGYLLDLKKRLDFKFNPKVINYEDSVPDSNWVIYDTRLKDNFNYKVLLNYQKKLFLEFFPEGNLFISKNTSKYSSGLVGIVFDLKTSNIKMNSEISIFRESYGDKKKEIIYRNSFDKIIYDNDIIKIDFNTKKINNIYKPVKLQISNLNEAQFQKINKIKLILKNKFDLKNFEVLDAYQNCYLIK